MSSAALLRTSAYAAAAQTPTKRKRGRPRKRDVAAAAGDAAGGAHVMEAIPDKDELVARLTAAHEGANMMEVNEACVSARAFLDWAADHREEAGNLGWVHTLVGMLEVSQDKFGSAGKQFEAALVQFEDANDVAGLCAALNAYGVMLFQTEKFKRAAHVFTRELDIHKGQTGTQSKEYADTLLNMGGCFQQLKQWNVCKPLYVEALQVYRDLLGVRDVHTAAALKCLALLYFERGDVKMALEYLGEVEAIQRKVCDASDPNYAHTVHSIKEIQTALRKAGVE